MGWLGAAHDSFASPPILHSVRAGLSQIRSVPGDGGGVRIAGRTCLCWCARWLLFAAAGPGALAAQAASPLTDSLQTVPALGLPRNSRFYAVLGGGVAHIGETNNLTATAAGGLHRDLLNPVHGLLAVELEAFVGRDLGKAVFGGRLLAQMPFFQVGSGLELSTVQRRPAVVFTYFEPIRRGGLLFPGAGLRLDWVPARGAMTAGVRLPLTDPHPGRTRPRHIEVRPVERGVRPAGDDALPAPVASPTLARLADVAEWSARLTLPLFAEGAPGRTLPEDSLLRDRLRGRLGTLTTPHTVADEFSAFHETLTAAFREALDSGQDDSLSAELTRAIADSARSVLLREVLIPYDRDLGQWRGPEVLRFLGAQALWSFTTAIAADGRLGAAATRRVVATFESVLAIVDGVAYSGSRRWRDTRMGWVPLQFGLLPDQYDDQSELDGLLARVTGEPFREGNDLIYATDERFEAALRRSILETRRYHVLWIHDFVGRNARGAPDSVTRDFAVEPYLRALTRAVRAVDSGGSIPAFLILLDQYYYKRSSSGFWLRLLRDPLGYRLKLRPGDAGVAGEVRSLQDTLRQAVAGSARLQALAQRRGTRWLHDLVSVRVNVTNPPDPSFRSVATFGAVTISVPDDVMRDHRKIAFSDLSEAAPDQGIAILTGLGVGESYARYRWFDRTIVLRGPAALSLKGAARRLLLRQGFAEADLPDALRPASDATPPPPPDGWIARAAIVMNQTGYGEKRATAAKAVLYSLMPPGSTIIASDPQWLSRFWGGMLLGSALRGCRVLLVAPGPLNSPMGPGSVQLALQRDLLRRLLEARAVLVEELQGSGGMLQAGLFGIGLGTHNVVGGVHGVRDGLRRNPFLRDVLPFDQSVWDLFESADSLLQQLGVSGQPDTIGTYHPKFHLKTQFFGAPRAMREAVGRPEWREFFTRRIGERLHEPPAGTDILLDALRPVLPYLASRGPAELEGQVLYLMVGSHNQDPRSFMLDGEASCLVAGAASLISIGDMLVVTTVGVTWLHDAGEIDAALPSPGHLKEEVARLVEGIF